MVMVVVILLFRSIFYGLTSLQTLLFGVAAGVGLFGWLGLNLSPSTSGAISVGIGIAVDFGIQPVSRYREERKHEGLSMKDSLFKTLEGTVRPMTLGLIAAIMGFSTLAIGDVTFLSDLGIILSLTTLMAYLSALTVIPSTLILHDKYLKQKINQLKNTIL
jgi:predicted RND superfamily exporter protein